jgi:Methyltransferase FkbM domain
MSIIQNFRVFVRNNHLIRKIIAYYVVPSGLFDSRVLNLGIGDTFKYRIKEVIKCPDNAYIERVKNAGIVSGGKQTMHNGLKIHLGSYYGPEVAQQLYANKGVHEPQEEYVFQEVLNGIRPQSTMIELGAFWSFYSMWFNSKVNGAKNYMVEPDSFNLGCGKRNFQLNSMKGDFTQAFVGSKNSTNNGERTIGIDDFCVEKGIDFVDILHCDIQGFEYDMLLGSERMINEDQIGYFFISTHSNEVHYQCLNHLKNKRYIIVASADLDQTFAEDGLIVAKSPNYSGIDKVDISLKTKIH